VISVLFVIWKLHACTLIHSLDESRVGSCVLRWLRACDWAATRARPPHSRGASRTLPQDMARAPRESGEGGAKRPARQASGCLGLARSRGLPWRLVAMAVSDPVRAPAALRTHQARLPAAPRASPSIRGTASSRTPPELGPRGAPSVASRPHPRRAVVPSERQSYRRSGGGFFSRRGPIAGCLGKNGTCLRDGPPFASALTARESPMTSPLSPRARYESGRTGGIRRTATRVLLPCARIPVDVWRQLRRSGDAHVLFGPAAAPSQTRAGERRLQIYSLGWPRCHPHSGYPTSVHSPERTSRGRAT
jgi:hypothetical protein